MLINRFDLRQVWYIEIIPLNDTANKNYKKNGQINYVFNDVRRKNII